MKKAVLSNGLRVMTEKMSSCRSVSFGIWVRTGSRHENEQNNGISHFIEHMLFKGTKRHSPKQIAEIFDGIGGNVNAFTSKEYTCYYAKVLDKHLPIALDVLSDMFFNSVFDAAELAKEKNVITEEIAMYEDTPDDLVHDLISKAAYGDHSLAYSILGTEDNVNRFESGMLRDYMNHHYFIENTVLSMAGNISDGDLELIEAYFGKFANHGATSAPERPEFVSDTLFHHKTTEQNHICLSLPGCSLRDPSLYAMVLLNNTLGGGMSSRLFQEIREKRGLAYSVYSYHSASVESGLFTIYAGTAPKQTEEVLDVTVDLLNDVRANGITDHELAKGKEQLKGSLILSLESTGSRMNRLGKNELMLGRHDTLDEMIARIDAVTAADIRSVVQSMFSKPYAAALVGKSDEAMTRLRANR